MHQLALVLTAAAGLAYALAGWQRWRSMGAPGPDAPGRAWTLWGGFALQSLALALSLLEPKRIDFAFGVLAVWTAVAVLLFARRFLAAPSWRLLGLPLGGMAVLVAAAGINDEALTRDGSTAPVVVLHIAFMSLYLAAMLIAGAAAGLWWVGVAQLKRASPRALRLPALPVLERVSERALVVATALLMGGLATGGAALHYARDLSLTHPTFVLAELQMLLLVLVLGLRALGRLSRRAQAFAAITTLLLAVLSQVGVLLVAHG